MIPFLAQADAETPAMVAKLAYLWPEITLFITTCVVMVLGLSPNRAFRKSCAAVSVLGLGVAFVLALFTKTPEYSLLPGLMAYAKPLIAAVGVLLILMLTGTVDQGFERAIKQGAKWDPLRSTRGEFYAFALFSLTGLMLCATADDLIWLFLALELTSLPTYVMVSISSSRTRAQEAGIKYFFLGALGAAMFLYGFALLYGATGTTQLWAGSAGPGIAEILATRILETGSIGSIATVGLVLAMVGVSFKIAAVPMHFYTPDVYEGASSSVAAFLAFVPKAAGFITLILLASVVGWGFGGETNQPLASGGTLPEPIRVMLWVVAALTMTVGNVMALLQSSVKRILAYSSVAHSGYMLVGVIVGPGSPGDIPSNGIGAALFYLLCYGFMNLGAFGALACLERMSGEEIESVDDLKGMCATYPWIGWPLVLCSLSLLGLPPLLGFAGKVALFSSAIWAQEIVLVVVMGINSAIAAYYYLRIAGAAVLEEPGEVQRSLVRTASFGRIAATVVSGASVIVLFFASDALIQRSADAGAYRPSPAPTQLRSGESAATQFPLRPENSQGVTPPSRPQN